MHEITNCYLDLPDNKETRKFKIIAYATILLPFFGFVYLILNLNKLTVYSVTDGWLFTIFYLLSTIGISVGFHRGLAHKSFVPSRWTKIFLAILGSIAAQGSALFWVATHRRHHIFSDTSDDIHSPNTSSNRLTGFFYAHLLWMTKGKISNPSRFAKDLSLDKDMQWVSKKYLTWVVVGVIAPGFISLAIHQTIHAFVEGLIWGGFGRIFVAHHVTWALNSLAHLHGKKAFRTTDQSHNISALAIISVGESWHNNHHAFPYSAKFGILKGQIDIGYLVILMLARLNLVTDIKNPTLTKIKSRII